MVSAFPMALILFSACSVTYEGSQAVLKCSHSWNIAQAPQGYYYYYNTVTQGICYTSGPSFSEQG